MVAWIDPVNWRNAEQADERLWATETEYMAGLLGEDGDAFLEEDETGSRTDSSSPPHVDTQLDAEAELLAQLEAELAAELGRAPAPSSGPHDPRSSGRVCPENRALTSIALTQRVSDTCTPGRYLWVSMISLC